jgi:RimJ/RimL family protein N-acetyltransferase
MSTPKPVASTAPAPILIDIPEELIGPRVLVRPYRPGDGPALWEAVEESREHIEPWLPWGPSHRCPDDSEALVRRANAKWHMREDLGMSVWDRSTGRYLGGTGLHRMNWDIPSFEIGYWLRKTAEGHGYITETVRLLIQLAFDTLHANRLYIHCAVDNVRSSAIPRRLGFLHEGRLRNHARNSRGELYDLDVYAMTPEDFVTLRQAER